jgi:hypothetical protein
MKKNLKYKNIKIADAGYVINLPERTDRKESVLNILNKLEITNWELEDGVKFEDPFWKKFGCTKAYLNIFEKALRNGYESIIIFEDDIKITQMIDEDKIDKIFRNLRKESKKYDLVALGTRPFWESSIIKDSDFFGTVSKCLCTQAFLYKRKFMEYAVNCLKDFQNPDSPYYRIFIDEFISYNSTDEKNDRIPNTRFNVGISIPLMFTQMMSYSDNEGCVMNYEGWIEDSYWSALNNGKQ